MSKTLYEHYFRGEEITEFSRELISPITNLDICSNKPMGGFWASRCDAEYGWRDWCITTGHKSWADDKPFIFSLTNDARILQIKSNDDMEKLRPYELGSSCGLTVNIATARGYDFERMTKDYDAIEVDGYRLYWQMYGWDCESILIFNPDVIEEVESD